MHARAARCKWDRWLRPERPHSRTTGAAPILLPPTSPFGGSASGGQAAPRDPPGRATRAPSSSIALNPGLARPTDCGRRPRRHSTQGPVGVLSPPGQGRRLAPPSPSSMAPCSGLACPADCGCRPRCRPARTWLGFCRPSGQGRLVRRRRPRRWHPIPVSPVRPSMIVGYVVVSRTPG